MKLNSLIPLFLVAVSLVQAKTLHEQRDGVPTLELYAAGFAKHVKRAPTTEWTTMVEKGKKMWDALNDDCFQRVTEPVPYDKLKELGWDLAEGSTTRPKPPTKHLRDLFTTLSLPTDNQYHVRFTRVGEHPDITMYGNTYGPQPGIIIANDNSKPEGTAINAVPSWSEVTWQVWKDSCRRTGADPKHLKTVIRDKVINKIAMRIIKQAHDICGKTAEGSKAVYRPDGPSSECFFALLGTPNGKGVAFLLLDHRDLQDGLGRKSIKSITTISVPIEDEEESHAREIFFEIMDAPADIGKGGSPGPGNKGDFGGKKEVSDTNRGKIGSAKAEKPKGQKVIKSLGGKSVRNS